MTQLELLKAMEWPDEITPTSVAGRRGYVVPALGHFASTTTVIDKTIGLWGHFLNDWYAKTERQAVLETVRQHFEWSQGMTGQAFVGAIEANLGDGRAAVRKMNEAADIGTGIHKAIQARIQRDLGLPHTMPTLEGPAWLGYTAWEEWWNKSGYTPIRTEQVVWDVETRTAGCIDCIALHTSGELHLLDWKSSNYIYAKHHIQANAYQMMAQTWAPVSKAFIVRVPKTLERLDMEIQPVGRVYDPDKRVEFQVPAHELWNVFKGARDIYRVLIEREFDAGSAGGRGERS